MEKLRTKIGQEAGNGLPFDEFMRMCLYDGEDGYYASGVAEIGRRGDFMTSVSVGALFGELLARQFEQVWQQMGRPQAFVVVEQGAWDGMFATDVLGWMQDHRPECMEALEYRIVEPFAHLRSKQQERLRSWEGKIRWWKSLEDCEPFEGVFFCNELLDSFPVRRVIQRGGEWKEMRVGWEEESGFVWRECGIEDEFLIEWIGRKRLPEAEGYTAEVCPGISSWVGTLSAKLIRGYALIVDYGYQEELLYHPERTKGSLQCYSHHLKDEDPLSRVGEKDITTHVDFSQVEHCAKLNNLHIEGFADQHHALLSLARHPLLEMEKQSLQPDAMKRIRQLRTLMHPEMMGTSFKFFGLSRGMSPSPPLEAFRGFGPVEGGMA